MLALVLGVALSNIFISLWLSNKQIYKSPPFLLLPRPSSLFHLHNNKVFDGYFFKLGLGPSSVPLLPEL